ncbi:hypothetical protein B0T26DRAFT_740131 [Lasiosphaeria miniovina]|uniref:Aminoglycoside phosphotransferase domain-containing protein n=1 Tax=Lasiosphaeria miniovina TaxID=1954250 RepID=A0AA40AW50_9PEZI|nr:uncharacterized protein B0T26DRAFT_740131 [Lasiosphaeria miniovina]KAK0723087.1 hypothetical protein B0T26DRAFT_740131 [Lasiosphaeria miniovina]
MLTLLRSGNSPFDGLWDANVLIRVVEENLGAKVIDIPVVYKGSHNYGFLTCNLPKFQVAVYNLLRSEPNILVSRLLYYRIPVQHAGPRLDLPRDIAGRHLFLFERAEGVNNVWRDLSPEQRTHLLAQSVRIRASLFHFNLPPDFAAVWLRERLFEQKPKSLPIPVAPTRDDHATVGPITAAAKQSLLRLVPHIIPTDGDQTALCRLVLEHGDFGIHNMSIKMDANGQPLVTLYDWETGCEKAAPLFIRVPDDATPDDRVEYMTWARQYFKILFNQALGYERAI